MFYVWDKVTALEQYAPGYVIVEAHDDSAARLKAMDGYDKWLRENKDWLFTAPNEDDYSEIEKLKRTFREDIYKTAPKLMDCLLIRGSD